MRQLRVILPPIVQDQIAAHVFRIAEDSIDIALKWEDRLRKAIERIGEVHGHAIDEEASERLGFVVRKNAFEGTYLIHYCVDEAAGVVRIVNFRHGARLPRVGEP